jgi:hypothetical protein
VIKMRRLGRPVPGPGLRSRRRPEQRTTRTTASRLTARCVPGAGASPGRARCRSSWSASMRPGRLGCRVHARHPARGRGPAGDAHHGAARPRMRRKRCAVIHFAHRGRPCRQAGAAAQEPWPAHERRPRRHARRRQGPGRPGRAARRQARSRNLRRHLMPLRAARLWEPDARVIAPIGVALWLPRAVTRSSGPDRSRTGERRRRASCSASATLAGDPG